MERGKLRVFSDIKKYLTDVMGEVEKFGNKNEAIEYLSEVIPILQKMVEAANFAINGSPCIVGGIAELYPPGEYAIKMFGYYRTEDGKKEFGAYDGIATVEYSEREGKNVLTSVQFDYFTPNKSKAYRINRELPVTGGELVVIYPGNK